MGQIQRKSWSCIGFALTISLVSLISLGAIFMSNGIQGVESFGYDDYGGADPYGDGGYDHDPSAREDMMTDIHNQRNGYPNELSTHNKKFKLFEKRRLTYDKAKAFCKKREGQLAQALNVDEMQRIQTLLMRGTTLSSNIWVGADKREWKKHSSKMLGLRPNLPANAMMMGGGPTTMCPAMSISTRSLAPVECFKEFPFICEFPPGKGKAPPKTAKKEKKKTTRKEEMRRKREIIKLSPEVDEPSSTTPYDFTPSFHNTDNEVLQQGATPLSLASELGQTTTGSVEEYERHHILGFHPHVVFSSGKYRMEGTTPSTDSSGYTEIENRLNDVDEAKGPEVDPDQQMLDLFDEQLENMRRIISPDQQGGSTLRDHDQKPSTTQRQHEENIELTSELPTDKDNITMSSVDDGFVTNNQLHTEEGSSEISTSDTRGQGFEDVTDKTGLMKNSIPTSMGTSEMPTNVNETTMHIMQNYSTKRF